MSGGSDYDARFGRRMTGAGPYAWAIGRRFELACRQLGLSKRRLNLSIRHFRPPARKDDQPFLPGLLEEESRQ